MKYLVMIYCFLCLTLLFPIYNVSGNQESKENGTASLQFKSGVQLFKKNKYEQALDLFLQAQSLGLERGSLFYNIGVCYYKLARYHEAEQAFRKTAAFPEMAPLAYYNLGIVFIKQSDNDTAEYWLKKSYNEANESKLKLLAKNALNKIETKVTPSPWKKYISFGVGYDDNVELIVNSETLESSNQGDSFIDFFAFFKRPLQQNDAKPGHIFQGTFSYLKYLKEDEYDTGYANMRYLYQKKTNNFHVEGGVGYAYTLIDGRSYEQSPELIGQTLYSLTSSEKLRFRYRLNYLDILDSDYDYLEGWRHRFRMEILRKVFRYKAYLSYILELNDRDNDDYSPTRHTFAAGLTLRYLKNVDINLYLSYRESHYDIEFAEDRDDDRIDTRLNVTYYLKDGWEMSARYQYIYNDSNYTSYDFSRNVVTFSIARFF